MPVDDDFALFGYLDVDVLTGAMEVNVLKRQRQKLRYFAGQVSPKIVFADVLLTVEVRKLKMAFVFDQHRPQNDFLPGDSLSSLLAAEGNLNEGCFVEDMGFDKVLVIGRHSVCETG